MTMTREKFAAQFWFTQGLTPTVSKIIKEDKDDIHHDEEKANSLGECKLDNQTLKLVKETKKDFPHSVKIKSKKSTSYSCDGSCRYVSSAV